MLYDFEKQWQKSIKIFDNTWWGYQDYTFVENYQDWLSHNWNEIKKDEIINIISNNSLIEEQVKKLNIKNRNIKEIK
jgi:hypothetical protein